MNKKKARIEAENNTRTFGELLELVESTRGKRPMSVVNKSLTLDQVLDIYKAWLSKRNPNDKPKTMKYNVYKERITLSGDGLGVVNVLRECA